MSQERFASSSLRDFILEEELCRGTHASIWKVKFKYDGKRYVLKELKLNGKISQRNAYKEVELLRQLDHRNCIRCYGHFVDDANKKICIVLEYCEGGDLAQFLTNQRNQSKYLDEGYIWSVFHQICLGVQHLHQMGIVHRDLKTSNIFLADNTPKVGDLGVSHQVSENTLMLQTFSGTPLYLSPELVRGHPYNEKTDIWSLGIVLYELCALTPPFFGGTLLNLAQAIDSAEIPPLPSQYSQKIDRFVKWLLQRDYTQRPSIAQMVEKISKRLTPIQNIHFPPASRNDLATKAEAVFNAVAALDAKPSSTSPPIASAPSHLPESLVFDIQRLTILEKRDKMSLRKLLQTKTLSESSTCDQSQRSDQGLNDHIRIVQDRLTLLEEAISSGGRIQRDNAERSEPNPSLTHLSLSS
jgi:serine/threonine protein kinase